MTNNISSLFNGNFYIEPSYGLSLIPYVFNEIRNPSAHTIKEADVITKVTSEHNATGPDHNGQKVVIIDFNQPVVKYTYGGYLGTQSLIKLLRSFENNPDIAGVVFNIDSGGGQCYGTPEYYDFIKTYTKPLVTFTNGYLCSAAYYMAAPTNYIIANKRAEAIGSIGAYATFIDYPGILEHFGAKVTTAYSSLSDEKNADYRAIMEEGNTEPYVKNQLDPIVETFIDDMKAARPGLNNKVFKGGTWNGNEALDLGLIDANGSLTDAVNKVLELAISQNANNSNTNNKTMTKTRKHLQAALNLEAPLESTEELGSYLNEEQLDAVEARLDTLAEQNESLAAQLATAQDPEQNEQLVAANSSLTAAEASINDMLTEAGIEPTGTLAEKTALLTAKVTEMAAKDGAQPTNTVIDPDQKNNKNFKLDSAAAHNQLADQIHNN